MKGAGTTAGMPALRAHASVASLMRQVLYALCPGICASTWFFGPGLLIQLLLAIAFALLFECAMLAARGQPLGLFLGDGSAVLCAVLFALCLPPLAPWWISCLGMLFAVVVAKHLYGGLGHNVFNPAMVGYVVVLVGFPQLIAASPAPNANALFQSGWGASLAAIWSGPLPAALPWDAVAQATGPGAIGTALHAGQRSLADAPGAPGSAWMALAYAVGGAWLLWRRVISWHVPLAMVGGVLLPSLLVFLGEPASPPTSMQQPLNAALVLGAFFIATDPVSGCSSWRGRLVFGLGAGILTWLIRQLGTYPEGVAFAVLIMNSAAPLIDRCIERGQRTLSVGK
jgi:electron transport complex protein RnfD